MPLVSASALKKGLTRLSKNVVSNYQSLPWFIYDLQNFQLITSKTIPTDINDSKNIVLAETPIPGLNYSPVQAAGSGNRKISFTLPLIKKNNLVGNILLLAQFQQLRNVSNGFMNFKSMGLFTPSPKVVYYWGTGSLPLEYFMAKCDFVHKSAFVNALGQTQFSEVSIELILDENSTLYKAEEVYRKVNAAVGSIQGVATTSNTKSIL